MCPSNERRCLSLDGRIHKMIPADRVRFTLISWYFAVMCTLSAHQTIIRSSYGEPGLVQGLAVSRADQFLVVPTSIPILSYHYLFHKSTSLILRYYSCFLIKPEFMINYTLSFLRSQGVYGFIFSPTKCLGWPLRGDLTHILAHWMITLQRLAKRAKE